MCFKIVKLFFALLAPAWLGMGPPSLRHPLLGPFGFSEDLIEIRPLRAPKGNKRISTIHVQELLVSGRVSNLVRST